MDKKEETFNLSPEIGKLAEKLAKDPKSKLFLPLAEEYAKGGMFEEALLTLKEGLKHNPGYIGARVSLGKVYLKMGQLNEAETEFTKVLQADPENLVAIKKLAEIYETLNKKEEAINCCKRVLSLYPKDQDIVNLLASLETNHAGVEEVGSVTTMSSPGTDQKIEAEPEVKIEPTTLGPEEKGISSEESLKSQETEEINMESEEAMFNALVTEGEGPQELKKEVVMEGEERVPVYEIADEDETDVKSLLGIQDKGEAEKTQIEQIEVKPEEPIDDFLKSPPDLDSFVTNPWPAEVAEPAQEYLSPEQKEEPSLLEPLESPPVSDSSLLPKDVQTEPQVSQEDLATKTLAELYIKQGLYDKGIEIYRTLLKQNPGDEELKQRLEDAIILSNLLFKKSGERPEEKGIIADIDLKGSSVSVKQNEAVGGGKETVDPHGKDDIKKRLKIQRLQSWLDNIKRGY